MTEVQSLEDTLKIQWQPSVVPMDTLYLVPPKANVLLIVFGIHRHHHAT